MGCPLETTQVQNIAGRMVDADLIVRPAHGVYRVVASFVRKVWRDKLALTIMDSPNGA